MRGMPAVDDLITAEGYELLRSELLTLRTSGRAEMSERLREARADGQADDNPALFDAFEEQAQLERRIAVLEERLSGARIAEPNDDGSVGIGSAVRLRGLEADDIVEYKLVGAIEGSLGQGRVSVDAPVGRALIGAAAGDVVNVSSPRGALQLEVISVETPALPRRKAA